jgi:hypothetical protein
MKTNRLITGKWKFKQINIKIINKLEDNVYLKTILSSFFLIAVLSSIIAVSSCAQHEEHKHEQKKDQVQPPPDSLIVHEGIIDLQQIDENKDGMLFQDPMDWNVISDKPGKCPLCKMELKEVTLKEAKENLIENGFNVSDNKN